MVLVKDLAYLVQQYLNGQKFLLLLALADFYNASVLEDICDCYGFYGNFVLDPDTVLAKSDKLSNYDLLSKFVSKNIDITTDDGTFNIDTIEYVVDIKDVINISDQFIIDFINFNCVDKSTSNFDKGALQAILDKFKFNYQVLYP